MLFALLNEFLAERDSSDAYSSQSSREVRKSKIQRIVSLERTAYGLRSVNVLCGGFLAQRGRDAHPRSTRALNEEITVEAENDLGLEIDVLDLLETEPVTVWTGVELPYPGRFDRLIVFLSLHHEGLFTMAAPRTFLPGALRAWNTIYGIAFNGALAHLRLRAIDPADPKTGNEIGLSAYGPDAAGLAERLIEDVRAWSRIGELDPVFEVYPHTTTADLNAAGAIILEKRHSRIRITWPARTASALSSRSREPVVGGLIDIAVDRDGDEKKLAGAVRVHHVRSADRCGWCS